MKTIKAKLGKMRKEVSWVVYPISEGDTHAFIQSDKRCALIDLASGKGTLSGSHNYPIRVTLNMPGTELIAVSADVLASIKDSAPKSKQMLLSSMTTF